MSPAKSKKQQRFLGAEYGRAKAGLREMARKPKAGYKKGKR